MKLTNKDVKKLKEKGVDPSIILDLLLDEEQDPGTNTDAPMNEKPEKAPEEKNPAAQADPEEKKSAAGQTNDIQDQILKAIEKLTGAVQTSNLLNAGSVGPDVDTTEAALASIINPTGGK